MSEGTAPEPPSAASDSVRLPPFQSKWIKQEAEKFQKDLLKDIALLLDHHGETDLVEAFCSPDSMLTQVATASGLSAERLVLITICHQKKDINKRNKGSEDSGQRDFGCHLSVDPSHKCRM